MINFLNRARNVHWLSAIAAFVLLAGLSGCDKAVDSAPESPTADAIALEVFKSPTCGCCGDWITHVDQNGFHSTIQHPDDLNAVKDKLKIAPQYQSCHTAVSANGYVFEGHIPAWVIHRFLSETPSNAIGLAVPGMPIGSPGMEIGDRFTPYDVLLLKSDGSSEVFVSITLENQSGPQS